MKKHLPFLVFILMFSRSTWGQSTQGNLLFEEGKILNIQMELKSSVAQQAGGQAIDFNVDGLALHSFKVTNAAKDNTTLQHKANKIGFTFDGMGQKRSFDSDNEKDMEGPFSEPVKDILSKTFEMVIDPKGKVLTIRPEKMEPVKTDERLTMVFNMLKDITGVVYPPKKGDASFFKILPDNLPGIGDNWSDSGHHENGKFNTEYILSGITDSTIHVNFKGTSVITSKATMMGMETLTTMNSTNSGTIILDKKTGIIKEKIITTESNGNTEAMGGTMPVTSKTTIVIKVKPE